MSINNIRRLTAGDAVLTYPDWQILIEPKHAEAFFEGKSPSFIIAEHAYATRLSTLAVDTTILKREDDSLYLRLNSEHFYLDGLPVSKLLNGPFYQGWKHGKLYLPYEVDDILRLGQFSCGGGEITAPVSFLPVNLYPKNDGLAMDIISEASLFSASYLAFFYTASDPSPSERDVVAKYTFGKRNNIALMEFGTVARALFDDTDFPETHFREFLAGVKLSFLEKLFAPEIVAAYKESSEYKPIHAPRYDASNSYLAVTPYRY